MASKVILCSRSPNINVYVDETYLVGHSGIIQAAIPIPANCERDIITTVERLRTAAAKTPPREFKGADVSGGNRALYAAFLRTIVNFSAQIGDQTVLRPVVTVEGMARHARSKEYQWLENQVLGALANLGRSNDVPLAQEFSRRMWWIGRFLRKICAQKVGNTFSFYFDNAHRSSQQYQDLIVVTPKGGLPTLWPRWKLFRSFANTMLKHIPFTPPRPFPPIERIDGLFSEQNYFIQAADLFSHLFYNALKASKGSTDRKVIMKRELLVDVLPSLAFDAALTNALALSNGQLICIDANFGGTLQLEPV